MTYRALVFRLDNGFRAFHISLCVHPPHYTILLFTTTTTTPLLFHLPQLQPTPPLTNASLSIYIYSIPSSIPLTFALWLPRWASQLSLALSLFSPQQNSFLFFFFFFRRPLSYKYIYIHSLLCLLFTPYFHGISFPQLLSTFKLYELCNVGKFIRKLSHYKYRLIAKEFSLKS